VAAQIHRHARQPRPPRLVGPRGGLLPRSHERLLHEVVGVRRVARHPVTQPPQESLVGAEDIFKRRGRETLRSGVTHYLSPYRISHRATISTPSAVSVALLRLRIPPSFLRGGRHGDAVDRKST